MAPPTAQPGTGALPGTAAQPGMASQPGGSSGEAPDAASRRSVLVGTGIAVVAGAAGAAWYALAGPTPRKSPTESGYGQPSASGSTLAPLTDIPDGGGTVFDEQEIVVTRTGSAVHGFSAVCTHQGCLVSAVSGGEITCPCHGSAFDATTGAVVRGPARTPLPAVPVKVVGGEVVTG